MQTKVQAENTVQHKKSTKGGQWVVYAILGLLALMLVISVWNARLLLNIDSQVTATLSQQAGNAGVFLTVDGWQLGQLAPAIDVYTADAERHSFADVAAEHEVIYVAWDRCPICLEHFPELHRAASEVRAAGASFAMVILLSEADETPAADQTPTPELRELQETYGWSFPVFSTDQAGMLELNLQGTPTTLILRRGVLGEAFASSSFQGMTERMVAELGR